jgi:glycosyltransferase involved in cell wall biosynthesis
LRRLYILYFNAAAPYKMNLLYIVPLLPRYDRGSGENRLFEIIRLLRLKGCGVTVLQAIPYTGADAGRYEALLGDIGVRYVTQVKDFLEGAKSQDYDCCVIAWYGLAAEYISLLRSKFPRAKIIVDSVDVHWLRYARGVASGELVMPLNELEDAKAQEKLAYAKADEVWAVTEEDKGAIIKELTDCRVRVVSNIHRKDPRNDNDAGDKSGIVFVGGFNHPPNESAALWGYEISNKFRNVSRYSPLYYVVGDSPSEKLRSLHDGINTIVTGFVPDLHEYYKQSRAMIAPIKYGAGIKGKICHAICAGLPVITTDAGNDGLHLVHGKEALIANTTDEFVRCLDAVFSGKVDLPEMNKLALRKVLMCTSEEKAWEAISASLGLKRG